MWADLKEMLDYADAVIANVQGTDPGVTGFIDQSQALDRDLLRGFGWTGNPEGLWPAWALLTAGLAELARKRGGLCPDLVENVAAFTVMLRVTCPLPEEWPIR